jgi:hypothetical protein
VPYQIFSTSGSFTLPLTADPATVQVYAWGEGGLSGSSLAGNHSAGGGGSGAIAGEPALGGLHVGSVLNFTIGQGGSSTNTVVTGGSVTITAAFGGSASGMAAGTAGAAGANTLAGAGSAGGSGNAGTGKGGGSGAGSPGSTGAGGTGAVGSAVDTPGGAAGTGAAGPPSLAGAAGGTGGAPTHTGTAGSAPGAGGGGPGNSSTRAANNGGPGQVIIIWNTLNGVGLPVAQVSITALLPMPSPSSLKVTAAGGGGATSGILLRVRVLDNAGLAVPLNTGTQAASASQAADVTFTPEATGSLAYSAVSAGGATPAAGAGNTAIDSVADHGTYVSTATLTANTPFTAGSSSTPAAGGAAALEVLKYGGTITADASSPAVVNATGATTATTAAFTPPTGANLILALVSANGGTGVVSMTVTDSHGLTWTQAAAENAAGNGYAGIWYAYTPAALAFTAITPQPGVAGTAWSYTLKAAGGYGNYGWTLASGSLPAGLSLSISGVISGTPTTAGLSTFTVTVTDGFGNTATSPSVSIVINQGITGAGSIRQGWTAAAAQYTYGTLEVPVATTEHDWVFVAVSWQSGEDDAIAYCADNVRNVYQQAPFTPGSMVRTQVFCAPNARAASTVYVSTSAYVRWLTVLVLDVTGLQAGYVVDASNGFSGGPATSFTETLSTAQPDFIFSVGAFGGTPQTITQSGSGVTWNALSWAGINGNAAGGITQSAAWAVTGGAASPSMQFTGTSGFYSGGMVAVRKAGALPANPNPAWPVTKCYAAFGYQPQQPAAPPVWTDITSRYRGLKGPRGRSFELDSLAAADLTLSLDNFDGALSPQSISSPYYPNVTLITPVWVVKEWQGRNYTVFRGIMHAIPQTYDFQRGMVEVASTDDYSKLATTLLPGCMIQEMLYDQPLSLWPLNEQQGSVLASNWSGRSAATLSPVPVTLPGGTAGGVAASTIQYVTIGGQKIPVSTLFSSGTTPGPFPVQASAPADTTGSANPAPTLTTPATGFGNSNTGMYPGGLAGTQDSFWGNTTGLTSSSNYQGTVLVDANDTTLPLTATGATYSVWAQMYFVPSNTNAVIMTLTDQFGTTGKNYLTLSYDGTHVNVTQTAGSHSFSPASFLFDTKMHLWTVTVDTAGNITVYLDGSVLGSFAGTFPAGSPVMLQWGGDTAVTVAATAGIFTGCMTLAGAYDRVVDPERILSWYTSGATGFLDELAGLRIQRVLAWARWNAPQAVDPGLSLQQQFNYLTGGYGSSGLTGAMGNYQTAGGSIGIDSGAAADVTVQDIANTDNGFLFVAADGTLGFTQRTNIANFPVGLALGDTDYALNAWQTFESGLGPWTTTTSCTAAQSSGWSYDGLHSALMTVTGTPVTASVRGDSGPVTAGGTAGFSCWVMSPQGCTVIASIDFYNAAAGFISTASTGSVNVPPMTPVFLNLTGVTAPAGAVTAKPGPTITSSPATGTQLYFDHPRLSPSGFQVGYEPDVEITEDIQYLFNDIAITRNVDQASYRARDAVSRARYYPRIYTRTIFSSVDDTTAVMNCANFLLTNFARPALRVSKVTVDAALNPEAWPFVLSAGVGDSVAFTRTPVGGAPVTGTFTILSVEPDLAPDKARFTYVLAPGGVF